MWYLISESNPDIKYCILGGKVYVVGRRDCDILVTGDASVSRKHSELSMSHSETNLTNTSRLPILLLKDLSKFGTWVNKQKVEGERILKDGDIIHFGSPSSSFMVVYEPLVLTTSCLDTVGKKSVRQTLCTLGGHMINEWKADCSLLIMNKISVTIKVICALVSLKPIVNPAYLEAYLKQLQGTGEKPDPDRFIPELAETQLDPSEVSFTANSGRKTVFQGKTFVFISEKQLKKMSLAIELAGGMPMLTDGKIDRDLLLGPATVVMSCPDADITKDNQAFVTKVTALLQKNGKHLIPDAEVGYAVLYCSTDKHCNPDHIPDGDLSRLPSQTLSQMDPFAANTQSQLKADSVKTPREAHTSVTVTKGTPRASRVTRHAGDITSTEGANESSARKSRHSVFTESMTMNTGLQNTEAVEVKEEPLSGQGLNQRKGQKRHRVEEEEDQNETPVMLKRIKEEPVTPAPKQSNKPSDKPKPVSKKTEPEPVWDSDDELDYSTIDTDISPSRTKLSTNVSPTGNKPSTVVTPSISTRSSNVSPSRTAQATKSTNQQRSSRSSNKPASPVPFTRSESPSRGKPKTTDKSNENQTLRSRSRSPVDCEQNAKVSSITRSRSPVGVRNRQTTSKEPVSPTRSSPRRSRSRSPIRIKEEKEDVCEIVPSQGSRSSQSRRVTDQTKTRPSSQAKVTDTLNGGHDVRIKRDEEEGEEHNDKSEVLNGDVPSGFLTTRKPIEPQVKPTPVYQEDKELPTGCVTIEFTCLLARKPQVVVNEDKTRCPEGFTRWKGKIVKNFKRFKKSQNSGSQGLPNIIGGSDLEINQGPKSREMDEWFKEAVQAESQHTRDDRRDQDLFDYNPTNVKRKGRSASST